MIELEPATPDWPVCHERLRAMEMETGALLLTIALDAVRGWEKDAAKPLSIEAAIKYMEAGSKICRVAIAGVEGAAITSPEYEETLRQFDHSLSLVYGALPGGKGSAECGTRSAESLNSAAAAEENAEKDHETREN